MNIGRTKACLNGLLSMLVLASVVYAPAGSALEFQCEIPGDIRYIKVEIPGREKLCEVRVKYEANGEDKAVWHAQNDTVFCTERAIELKEKYEKTWDYTCTGWPDRDGITQLTPSQRVILDERLKLLVNRSQASQSGFRITAVKAVASASEPGIPGLLAFQFFLDIGRDYTEIILDNGNTSKVMAKIENLADAVETDVKISAALVHTISDTGTLEVQTSVDQGEQQNCFGSQVLSVTRDGKVSAKTPHRFVCHDSLVAR